MRLLEKLSNSYAPLIHWLPEPYPNALPYDIRPERKTRLPPQIDLPRDRARLSNMGVNP